MIVNSDPGDEQGFVDRQSIATTMKFQSVKYGRVVKHLECLACDTLVVIPVEDKRTAILCNGCKEVFKKLKK